MSRDGFNAYCRAKRGARHVVQWGNCDVWKVGGKLFALAGWGVEGRDAFTFKVSEGVYELFHNAPGYRPAPYLASRGMSWLQIHDPEAVLWADVERHLDVSYELVLGNLTHKAPAELGLES